MDCDWGSAKQFFKVDFCRLTVTLIIYARPLLSREALVCVV